MLHPFIFTPSLHFYPSFTFKTLPPPSLLKGVGVTSSISTGTPELETTPDVKKIYSCALQQNPHTHGHAFLGSTPDMHQGLGTESPRTCVSHEYLGHAPTHHNTQQKETYREFLMVGYFTVT